MPYSDYQTLVRASVSYSMAKSLNPYFEHQIGSNIITWVDNIFTRDSYSWTDICFRPAEMVFAPIRKHTGLLPLERFNDPSEMQNIINETIWSFIVSSFRFSDVDLLQLQNYFTGVGVVYYHDSNMENYFEPAECDSLSYVSIYKTKMNIAGNVHGYVAYGTLGCVDYAPCRFLFDKFSDDKVFITYEYKIYCHDEPQFIICKSEDLFGKDEQK